MEPRKSGEILFKRAFNFWRLRAIPAIVEAIETEHCPSCLAYGEIAVEVLRPLCACWTRHEAIMDHVADVL